MKGVSSQAVFVSECRARTVSLVLKEKEGLLVRKVKEALLEPQDPLEVLGLGLLSCHLPHPVQVLGTDTFHNRELTRVKNDFKKTF